MVTTTELATEAIVADAAARTGVPPESFQFLTNLDRLASSLSDEARLTPSGRRAVAGALSSALVVQARLARLVERHPEIARWPVPRPVFVTGLLRTGTTLVHNLLAHHPGLRVPALWELMNPAEERGDTDRYRRLADEAQGYVDEYNRIAPDLRHIHYLDARRPDECHRLLGNTFASMVYEMRYRVPSYGAWLRDRDLTEEYHYHRQQLQALLWRSAGGPVVLKCPFHLWSIAELVAVYPDARIVQLHRDPAQTVPSTCSLCVAVREARSDQVDREEIGRQWLGRIDQVIGGVSAARELIPPGQLLDVRYADLVADPIGTVAEICDFIGVPMTGPAESAMRAYLRENSQTKHGVHRYRPEDFGLDGADLGHRFAQYRQTFDC
jgi:hypothetical protein